MSPGVKAVLVFWAVVAVLIGVGRLFGPEWVALFLAAVFVSIPVYGAFDE